jgi:energy-converting hydrogenase Eha subunit G
MKFEKNDWVDVEFICGFKTRGWIAGIGSHTIFSKQWIISLIDRYPGHEFDFVILDESCMRKIK